MPTFEIPPTQFWMFLIAMAAAAACVMIHYEGIRVLRSHWLRQRIRRQRMRLLLTLYGLLLLHFLEIWVFALLFVLLQALGNFGSLVGAASFPLDYLYFSAVSYTTLGYGDVLPDGPIRMLAAIEALCGLVLVAWSASYTYLVMQETWGSQAERAA